MAAPARTAGLIRPHSTARFFASNRALFDAAAHATGITELHYEIAGLPVLVRCAGDDLVARTDPALSPRRAAPNAAQPALTINLWDSAVSGIAMPRAPWHAEELRPLGLVTSYCDDRFMTAVDVHTASLSTFDADTATAVFWLHDARKMAYWQSASPLRLILSWWGSHHGMQLTHAGAVATDDGAVLLIGGAGAGKSTTALACMAAGLDFFGDDYCFVTPDSEPRVHGVYGTAKLRPDSLPRVPAVRDGVRNPARLEHEKAIIDLPPTHPGRLADHASIRAIAAPAVTGRVATTPISPGAALRAMAPSTIFGLFGATPKSLSRLADVARRVPAFRLDVGDNLDAVVVAVRELATT